MSKLYLHSSKASSNVYTLDNRIKRTYKLLSFCCTNNMFNVNDYNNKIYITENSIDLEGTLTNGYYDINDLKDNISTVLNNICSGTITVTLDDNTNKYTISNDTHNFYFSFGTNTSNSARVLLGMNASDGTNATSQTSDVPLDLNTHKNIFIRFEQDDNTDIMGIDFFNTSLVINGTGSFGEILRYVDDDNFQQYVRFKDTKKLKVTIHDNNNNTVTLNSDYEIILQKV